MNPISQNQIRTAQAEPRIISAGKTEEAKETDISRVENDQKKVPEPDCDRYIPSETKESEKRPAEKPSDEKKSHSEKCTTNTDKVDAEIRKLKKQKKQIQQDLARASDDPKRQKDLKQKLSAIEQELRLKDNDSYRRQHAVVTGG